MNDFTIEELKDILSCIESIRSSSTISFMNYGALQEKVKSMIDRYCDHHDSTPNHDYEVEKCNKCGKLFI